MDMGKVRNVSISLEFKIAFVQAVTSIFYSRGNTLISLFSSRWRRHVYLVSQCTLPAPGGAPLPEPLNVAPSLSSLPMKETPVVA